MPKPTAPKPRSTRKRRKLWINLGLLFAAIVLGLAAIECGLRVFGVYFGPRQLIRDADRGWRHRPGAQVSGRRINAYGFVGEDFPLAKPAGEFRVLCMGDSCTFGQSVAPGDTYPAKLQALLRARRPKVAVRVINAGVNGYSSFQGLQWLESAALRVQPDVVTVYFGWNDHWLSRIGGPDKAMSGSTVDRVRSALSRVRLFELGVAAWHAIRRTANMPFLDEPQKPSDKPAAAAAPQPSRPLRVSLEDYEANLRAFVRLARAAHARVILLTAPNYLTLAHVEQLPESAAEVTDKASVAELRALHESYNAVVRRVAASERVTLVDLCALFAKTPDAAANFAAPPADFVHPSAAGFEIVAHALADEIEPILHAE